MSNFILVHNHDNGVDNILNEELFDRLRFLFSDNTSYRPLSDEEYLQRMELNRNAS